MIIIQTCPKCGADLQDMMLASNPPILQKQCIKCHWSWTAPHGAEEIMRVPFDTESFIDQGLLDSQLILPEMPLSVVRDNLEMLKHISYDEI